MLKGLREDYLHFLFEKRLLGSLFTTVDGDQLDIIDFGEYNLNAGPDFLDCIVELNGQKWAGPIEFHVRASDWRRHGHQDDPAYSNVIASVRGTCTSISPAHWAEYIVHLKWKE